MKMERDQFARLLATGRILNPYTEAQLTQLGEVCRLREGQRQYDLACGRGEMLTRWSKRFGIGGVGVDNNDGFIVDAQARAAELGVAERVRFTVGDTTSVPAGAEYDVVFVRRSQLDRRGHRRDGEDPASGAAATGAHAAR
ncbi:SAM-dependent methyltransferase [Streptomyces albipurpureus]|uniref:Class I SAM-dependent methyltransferase n=1 Tax=Streptomyces albipurpureus TaxID=2897419 RepID=A0ABT0UHR9_9ACTN|nr:class I SAM-dependent methyltransferase [Streptomyces sp. CWNU-1]MCM2387975.1 class I SAM-dependent methyltransferase [Streptomyces sp. CWNU-1]